MRNEDLVLPKQVCKDLRVLVEILVEMCGNNLRQIILFGSFAAGKNQPNSDYDLCLVLDEMLEDRSEVAKIRNIDDHCVVSKEVDIVLTTTSVLKEGRHVFEFIKRDGAILYERV